MYCFDLQLGGREFDADRVKLTLEDAYTHVAGMTANMRKKDVAFLRETVAGVEREAAMTGMTLRQVAAEFLTRLESRPEGFKFVDAGNRVWDSKAYCEMLARTTLLNTSRQEYLNTCAENGADVVRVSVSGHCCEKCAVWENRLLSISGATKGLPTVDEAMAEGLFHPNCTHSLNEVDDFTREEEYNPDGTSKTGLNSGEDDHDNAAAAHGAFSHGGNTGQYSMLQFGNTAEAPNEHLAHRREQLETARQNRVKREAEFIGAPLIQGEHTREDDLKAVNPNYVPNRNGIWENNCQRCVVAYELRRRGIDVTALPCLTDAIAEDKITDDWEKFNGKAKWIDFSFPNAADRRGAAEKQMLAWGEGSRATVYVQWDQKDGHVFCAEVINGKVLFVDPQTGEIGVERYFSEQKSPNIGIARVDKLKIDEYSKKAVEAKK